jgi:hypothetical protein
MNETSANTHAAKQWRIDILPLMIDRVFDRAFLVERGEREADSKCE